jgi:uncharacterized phage infection (PIP) family protein YhgE
MVFANIYSKLNELERKINDLSSPGVSAGAGSSAPTEVDLTAVNSKLEAHDTCLETLQSGLTAVNDKLAVLPTEYASPQDVSTLYEKISQLTDVLAQFGSQFNGIVERVNNIENALKPPEDA